MRSISTPRSRIVRAAALAVVVLTMATRAESLDVDTIPCPAGRVLVGFTGWQGEWMEGIQGVCARIGANGTIDPADATSTTRAGGASGTPMTVTCAGQQVVTGFAGERSERVWDIHGIQCSDFDAARRTAHGSPTWRSAFTHKNRGSALAQFCLDGRVALGMIVETSSGRLDHFNLSCRFVASPNPQSR